MRGAWDDRIVTASSHLPPDLAAAVLEGGAKAVVCATEDAEPPPDDAAGFFRSLFSLLGNSVTLLQVFLPTCCANNGHLGSSTFLQMKGHCGGGRWMRMARCTPRSSTSSY